MIKGGFLSAKERAALQAVIRHPSETQGVARRANALLLLDDGLSCVEVSKVLYLDDDRVRTWLKHYRLGGLDKLTLFDWHGRSGYLSREQEAELSAHLSGRLYRDRGEVAAHIKASYGMTYSPSGCIIQDAFWRRTSFQTHYSASNTTRRKAAVFGSFWSNATALQSQRAHSDAKRPLIPI